MTYQEIISLVEQALKHAMLNNLPHDVVSMNSNMAGVIMAERQTTVVGLPIKIIDALPDGKIILE